MTGPDPLDYGWWLASRSAGVVSIIAVSVSVIIGLMMANGLPRKGWGGMTKRRLVSVHEATALAGIVAIAVHGLTLLGDAFIHPTLAQIAVPFTLDYRPGFTGLGIIAGWLAVFLGLSFYARRWIGGQALALGAPRDDRRLGARRDPHARRRHRRLAAVAAGDPPGHRRADRLPVPPARPPRAGASPAGEHADRLGVRAHGRGAGSRRRPGRGVRRPVAERGDADRRAPP